jgi:hypothetical protein
VSIIRDASALVHINLKHYSHSQDQSARKCRLKWYRGAVIGWQSRRQADPLHRGLSVHTALEHFHSLTPADRSLEALESFFNEAYVQQRSVVGELAVDPDRELREFDEWQETIGALTIENIWETYGQDEQVPKLSQTELTLEVPVPGTEQVAINQETGEIQKTGRPVPYQVRLDALVTDTAEPFIFETKTMGRDNREEFDAHDLQAPRNIYVVNEGLRPIRPVRKLLYNFIVFPTKSRDGILERREYIPSNSEVLYSIHDLALSINELMREDFVILHNFGKDCKWSCEYYNLCLAQKTGNGEIADILESDFTFREDKPGEMLKSIPLGFDWLENEYGYTMPD